MNITMFLGSFRSERVYMRNEARKLSVPACPAVIVTTVVALAGLKELAMRDIVALRQFF